MAAGDLSEDQRRFRDVVVNLTGLDPVVVTAWIGAESPWGQTKDDHNYLNIGPGEAFPSAGHAAGRGAALINTQPRYAGLRASRNQSPQAQIEAIIASPWGTTAQPLRRVFDQLADTDPTEDSGGGSWFDLPDLPDLPGPLPDLPDLPAVGNPVDAAKDAAGGVVGGAVDVATSTVGGIADAALEKGFELALGVVFTVAALALIALGLARLTGRDSRAVFDTVTGATGAARAVA